MPLYPNLNNTVTSQNVNGVAIVVPTFLCPSDLGQNVSPVFAPSNYQACAGSGVNGGSPIGSDGIFFVNSATRMPQIGDGASTRPCSRRACSVTKDCRSTIRKWTTSG